MRRPVEPKQYTSFDYTQTLDDHDVLASIGSVGDAFDNAMAESSVDSFKAVDADGYTIAAGLESARERIGVVLLPGVCAAVGGALRPHRADGAVRPALIPPLRDSARQSTLDSERFRAVRQRFACAQLQ